MLEFDWDEANSAHIAAHGVSCDEAEQVLRGDPFDLDYQSGTEERFVQIGETQAGRILIVTWTLRKTKVRVVTAYDPSKAIRNQYIIERSEEYGA